MKNEQLLLEKLERIQKNNFLLSGEESAYEIAKDMFHHIGSLNPYLRDDLIYSVLSRWIKNDRFTNEQLIEFLLISVDENHLFYGLGEKDTDTVFTRTFSILITAIILLKHNEKSFIPLEQFEFVKEKVFEYAKNENDIRGYVEEKGWAHSVAHLADCLDEIALCSESNIADVSTILELISLRIMESRNVFDCEEDERLVRAVVSILSRNLLSTDEINNWILSFKDYKKTGDYLADFKIKINSKHFLRSLYFRLDQKHESIKSTLAETLVILVTYR